MPSGWVKSEQEIREREIAAVRQLKRAKAECAGMPHHYKRSVIRKHRFQNVVEVRRIREIADRRGLNL